MDREDEWRDPLKRLIEDHEHVSEFLDTMDEIKSLLLDRDNRERFEPIIAFLDRNVVEHFAFEEDVIFPGLLSGEAAPETRELIEELRGEHAEILNDAEKLRNLFSKELPPAQRDLTAGLKELTTSLFDRLLNHSSLEDERLLPVVRENVDLFRKGGSA